VAGPGAGLQDRRAEDPGLRARAQQALGTKFSYAKFHEVVLGDGTLPLPILEAQVNRWIDSSR
jgi:uncharacterized protein (DUF885 family)